jgi:CheY-like chemotaxis protein
VNVTAVNELENDQGARLKILVADDDALNQRMMHLILSREGHEVVIASNGVEAYEQATNHEFDVILMDLQMPVLDGIVASRRIREWENGRKRTFIVALTASFLPERGQELFDAGIDNYISKPFDLEHLRQILRYSHKDNRASREKKPELNGNMPGFSFETGLQRVGGNEETYKELLEDFVRELPGRLETIDACHLKNDPGLLSRTAHNLKGVSANLGAVRLSEYAGKLEKQIDNGSGEIKHIIDMIQMAAEEFRRSAMGYLSK